MPYLEGGTDVATRYRSRRARLAALSESLRAQGWAWVQIARRIARDEHVNMRVAFRLAHGMSQREVAARWNEEFSGEGGSASMTDKVISYWETWPQSGYEPSLKSLKRLARIYQCNIGDLIDDGDFSHLDAAALHDRTPSAVAVKAATITKSAPRDVSDVGSLPSLFGLAGEDDEEVMRRRAFLMGLAALTGLGAAEPAMALEGTRHGLNFALAERHASTDVEEWHEIALEYGHTYPITAPSELLKTLLVDLYGLQAAIGRYPDDAIQRELRQAGAMLSAFTAQTVANLGYLREARRWWRTARRAADESGDRYTMLWIRGREIVRAGYEHRPLTTITQLIDEAEARVGASPPVAAMPELLGGKAQALALMGQVASAEAEMTLAGLRRAFEELPFPLKAANDSVFMWGEERLRLTESIVYTYLGDGRKAEQAQNRALALFPADDLRSPAQIELQRALCLVGAGDVHSGIRHAQAIVSGLPAMHRIRPVADLGHKVLRAVPAAERQWPGAQEYSECLTASFAVPVPELTA
jgi:hypothetical protein